MPLKAKSYAELTKELAEIIDWFENSEVDIDNAIKKYSQAMELVSELETYLKSAENKINKIAGAG